MPGVLLARTTIALAPLERQRLRALLAREVPELVAPFDEGYVVDRLEQPWFRAHNVLDVQLTAGMPVRRLYVAVPLGAGGAPLVLTGRLAALHQVAAADPPLCLDVEPLARAYAAYGNAWTSEARLGEMAVTRFDELPWSAELSEAQRTRLEVLRLRFAARLGPEVCWRQGGAFHLRSWWLIEQRLVERELVVPPSGLLERRDTVQAAELPVPVGHVWDVIGGKPTPVL